MCVFGFIIMQGNINHPNVTSFKKYFTFLMKQLIVKKKKK